MSRANSARGPGLTALLALSAGLTAATTSALAWTPIQRCGSGYQRWREADLPAGYLVNTSGSGTTEAQTLTVVQRCFDYWYEPCCSAARATRTGTTTLSPTANGDGSSVVGFASGSWPAELGDPRSTLGVTVPLMWSDCHIGEADILFNEVAHDFCYSGCSARDTSFEPVATHEIGHFFGLGHSADSSALMYYAYSGGTDARPRSDDVTGICTLYPGDHCACTVDGDCGPGLACDGGACVASDPCAEVVCDPGEECVGGSCVSASGCTICAPCTDNGPCGSNGQCFDRGDGQGRCMQFCGAAGSCPGDSVCFRAEASGSEVHVCLNPSADSAGICPDGYECGDCAATGCAPGEQCFDGGCRPDPADVICVEADAECTTCPVGADACVTISEDSRTICSARCMADADCGPCGSCTDTDDPLLRVCINDDAATVGACPTGWACGPETPDGDADTDVDTDVDADADGNGDGDAGDDDGGGGGDGGDHGPPGACDCTAGGRGAPASTALLLAVAAAFALLRRRTAPKAGGRRIGAL